MQRWTLRLLACLLLGASLNFAVTAASCWWLLHHTKPLKFTTKPAAAWPLPAYAGANWPKPANVLGCSLWGWTREVPRTARRDYWIAIDSFGWPMRGLRRVVTTDESGPTPLITCPEGFPLVAPPTRMTKFFQLLPTHPVFPGFAVNTVLYTSLFAFVWLGPDALRLWRHKRANCCRHCGYPIGDPARPCPECGRNVRT